MSEAENKSAFTDDEAVRIAREAFSVSDTYFNASIRNNMERDIRQVQGVHPHGSKYHTEQYRTRSKLFRPKFMRPVALRLVNHQIYWILTLPSASARY